MQKARKTLWHKQSSIEENTREQTLKSKTLRCELKNWKKWVEKNLSYFKYYVKINSPPVSHETTRAFWEKNLEAGAKTLKALLIQTPLHFQPTNIMFTWSSATGVYVHFAVSELIQQHRTPKILWELRAGAIRKCYNLVIKMLCCMIKVPSSPFRFCCISSVLQIRKECYTG